MGISYFLTDKLLEILDSLLGLMALDQPSFLYLAIALLGSINATALWYFLDDPRRLALIQMPEIRVRQIHRAILWTASAYLILRFPPIAFAVPPAALGRVLLTLVMFSLLFAPLWIGLVVLVWKMTRRAYDRSQPHMRRCRAAMILSALGWWGVVGELRMLLDPTLLDRIGRIPQ